QQCSSWESVGKVAAFWQDINYSQTVMAIAYQKSTSGTCFNLDEYVANFDNQASSYKLYAPSDASATFFFYKGYDCTDTSASKLSPAGGSNLQPTMNDPGGGWNDRLPSVMVVYGETVTAENVTVSISGNKASSDYDISVGDSEHTTESGSTYVWYRASDSS